MTNAAPVWYAIAAAHDLAPGNFRDGDLGIPESGNGIPDILDELEWGMDWALTMQDEDGGVFWRIASRIKPSGYWNRLSAWIPPMDRIITTCRRPG